MAFVPMPVVDPVDQPPAPPNVLGLRKGDNVVVTIMDGGTLHMPEGLGAAKVQVEPGGTLVLGLGAMD